MRDFYSVLLAHMGYPINQKPTRVMYEAGLRAMGLDWRYLLLNVKEEMLPGAMTGVRAFGLRGANLTMPLKVAAIPYMDALSPEAGLIGAINTICNEDGRLTGFNTDGAGHLSAVKSAGMGPGGARMVILGAGGAARAIGVTWALNGASSVTIINRDPQRAQGTVAAIQAAGCAAEYLPWTPGLRIPPCDILVNATPVGLAPDPNCPDLDYGSLRSSTLVSDAVMNPPDTLFLRQAGAQGCTTVGGLEMLVEQGILCVELWTGQRPPAAPMMRALKDCFGLE